MRTQEEYDECLAKARKLLALAKLRLVQRAPYFGTLLRQLIPVPAPGYGTIGVDNKLRLYFDPFRVVEDPELGHTEEVLNPSGTKRLPGMPECLAAVLAHELEHVVRDMERVHRLAKVDPKLANIAADVPINESLRAAGWKLPSWGVFPEKYGAKPGSTMEQVFDLLLKKKKQEQEQEQQGQGQDPQDDSLGNQELDVCSGQCGEVGGNPGNGPPPNNPFDPGQPQTKELPGRDPSEVSRAVDRTAQDAAQHFYGRSDAPAWVSEVVKRRRVKQRNWKKEVERVARQVTGDVTQGDSDFSLARPSKNSLMLGIPLAGLVDQDPTVVLALDSSGSMGQRELGAAKDIIARVLSDMGLEEVLLCQCDASIQAGGFKKVRPKDIDLMKVSGRGGTDFRPIFLEAEKLRPKPDLLFILTDGDGPAPLTQPTGTRTIWVIVPSPWQAKPATWGHYVVCSDDPDVVDKL